MLKQILNSFLGFQDVFWGLYLVLVILNYIGFRFYFKAFVTWFQSKHPDVFILKNPMYVHLVLVVVPTVNIVGFIYIIFLYLAPLCDLYKLKHRGKKPIIKRIFGL